MNQTTRKGYRIAREGVRFFPARPGNGGSGGGGSGSGGSGSGGSGGGGGDGGSAGGSQCDPNHGGACVPVVSYDLDCADIDGPVYIRRDDPHRFDGDGDGVGCEP